MKSALLFSAAALALAGCGTKDEADMPPDETAALDTMSAPSGPTEPAGTPATPTDAASYVVMAGAGDLWEIESSKALLAKSRDAGVRKFAQMMIDQHGQSTAKIKAAASAADVAVPAAALDSDQQKMLDAIKSADAAGIDAIYLAHQRTAHDAALALHQAYATNGDTDGLKKVASEIVPVVEAHRTELGKLGTPA